MAATLVAWFTRQGELRFVHIYRVTTFDPARDLSDVSLLYEAYGGEYLPVPGPADLVAAAEDGHMYVVREKNGTIAGAMVGAAGVFRLGACEKPGSHVPITVYEMAGMVLNPVVRGLGLQQKLLALRSLGLARQAWTNTAVIASVAALNARSSANVIAMGFRETPTPSWLRLAHRGWTSRSTTVVDFVLGPGSLAEHAKEMLAPGTLRLVKPPSGDVRIEFDVTWLYGETDFLAGVAEGDRPEWETTIPDTRLIGHAPDWVRFNP